MLKEILNQQSDNSKDIDDENVAYWWTEPNFKVLTVAKMCK